MRSHTSKKQIHASLERIWPKRLLLLVKWSISPRTEQVLFWRLAGFSTSLTRRNASLLVGYLKMRCLFEPSFYPDHTQNVGAHFVDSHTFLQFEFEGKEIGGYHSQLRVQLKHSQLHHFIGIPKYLLRNHASRGVCKLKEAELLFVINDLDWGLISQWLGVFQPPCLAIISACHLLCFGVIRISPL